MQTPEPRARGSAGKAALAATPPVTDLTPATPHPVNTDGANSSAPAAPRAGFLRRGNEAPHGAIAAGPSVLFDDDSTATPSTTAATTPSLHTTAHRTPGFDASPQPSQLTQLLQHPQQSASGQARLPRQRPRFHTVQDLDVALNQAIEGKITSRNAWASKEASDLLEGITHTIETTLDAGASDDYAGFAKAATVVEGCSKVWTSRVDSTYQQSNQMVQRLLRKEDGGGGGMLPDGEGGGEEGADEEQQPGAKSRSRSAASAAAAAAAAARTLAMEATEINLDSKARTALTQTGVNAQFRAITSKFDQGNAQGLLMNNAPLGRAGNIILDVDYAALPGAAAPAVSGAGRSSGGRRTSGTEGAAVDDAETAEQPFTTAAAAPPPATRLSQHAVVEVDAAVYDNVLADLPSYRGVPTSSTVARSTRGSEALAAPPTRDSVDAARASQASAIDPLLLLPHAAPPKQETAELARVSLKSEAAAAAAAAAGGGSALSALAGRGDALEGGGGALDGGGGFGDDDDVAGGGDAYDEDDGWGGGDDSDEGATGHRAGTSSVDDGAAGKRASGADRGAEARRLVSGAVEMEMIDTLFHGHTQLALEAEDPTSWCPLSEVSANPLTGVQSRSELSRLHREHRFTQPQRGGDAGGTAASSSNSVAVAGAGSLVSGGAPAAKRSRKERTVVFQLPDASGAASALPSSSSATFDASMAALLRDDGALRQAMTAGRHITPLGKQLLLAKDATHAVLAYTQSATQRSKAEQAGLLLPDAPVPGKTIPAYLPYPIHTQDFFQPFSTGLAHWNLLRKSATGHLVDSAAGAAAAVEGGGGGGASAVGGSSGGSISHLDGGVHGVRRGRTASEERDDGVRGYDDMPVEFFPGGAEVEAEDGGEAGGDYADYAELYGADGDDDDDAEEQRYVHGGFRGSAEARLLAQMDVAAAAAAAATGSAASGGSSMRSSGAASDAVHGTDPLELLKVLSPPEATLPTQVDVVRLRQLMWEALQGHLSAHQQTAAIDLATLRANGAAATGSGSAASAAETAAVKGPLVKAHALAALSKLRRRNRGDGAGQDEKDDEERVNEGGVAVKEGESGHAGPPSGARGTRAAVDPFLADGGTASPASAAAANVALTRFSDVVRSVLPHVASISSTNTLSPAFFFFSILFLANEYNVVLQSVEGLDDLRACGIARRVGE